MIKILWSLWLVSFLEFTLAQPRVTEAQFLPDLVGTADIRFPLLSPDGKIIFYEQDDALCFFEIDGTASECYAYSPETFRGLGRYSAPVWSPDSTRVIFTESVFDRLVDGDLWQLGVATGDYTNLTNDGIRRWNIGDLDPAMLLDYLPTFSPQGELYFFRSRPTFGINEILGPKFSLELFKLTETGEAVRVSSLRPQLPVLSISQPAVISPDGQQIAFIVLGPQFQEDATSGVWVQDLATGQRELVLRLSDLPNTLPAWLNAEYFMIPRNLSWTKNNELLIKIESQYGDVPSIASNTLQLDLATKTVTALEDFSSLSEDVFNRVASEETPLNKLPMTGFVTPDEAQYIYVGSSPNAKDFFLWSRSLPFKNETADLLTRIPKPVNNDSETFTLPGAFDTSATVSSNGKRALILGYLLTLE